MNPIYEKLFDTYGESVLQELDNAYDDQEILAHLDTLQQNKKARLHLQDLFFEYRSRWSVDAFALGLHLGLSLLHDDVRRIRLKQVQ